MAHASSLEVELLCEYDKISGQRTEVTLMAKLKAPCLDSEERRAPITICAAIDRSGSMKNHLPLLKDTLKFVIKQLRADDKLFLVTFDHEVNVELPLTGMDAIGKQKAEKAVEGIKERGHTNLSGGLLAALNALYQVPAGLASTVESVLLFTDGKPNSGIVQQDRLVKATSSMLSQIGRQACVYTFGYGAEHDADLLNSIASAGNGIFYYIDNQDNIPESFCDCLGGLLSVTAQNIQIRLKSFDKVKFQSPPLTTFKTTTIEPGQLFEVVIPDICSEEEKCLVIKALAPQDPAVTEAVDVILATCEVSYFDALNCKQTQQHASCRIVRDSTCATPTSSPSAGEIELHRVRCEVADSLGQANRLAQVGDIPAAQQVLRVAKAKVQKCVAFANPLVNGLLETVDQSMDGLKSADTYQGHGKAVLATRAAAHWQQRSNVSQYTYTPEGGTATTTSSEAPYRSKVKSEMLLKHKRK